MRNQKLGTAALLGILLMPPLAGDRPVRAQEEGDPPDSGVTERVEVRLVQMSILARNRKGRPVADLTAEEIVVKDRGRRMKVAFLNPVRRPQFDGPAPDVRLHVGAPGGWEGEKPAADKEPSYLILFVDAENDQRLQKPEAIVDAIRFIEQELDPNYRVAVFSYDGGIHQDSMFTTDREAAAMAVRRAFDRPPRPHVDVHARMRSLISQYDDCVIDGGAFVKRGDEACIRSVTQDYAEERRPLAEDYLNALEGVVRYASGLRGRKTIMALSHGVPANAATEAIEAARAVFGTTDQLARIQLSVGFSDGARLQMDRLIDLAIRQKVTLHFVDRNLAPSSGAGARQGQAFQPGARPILTAFEAPQWDLEELATHTGGIFVGSPGALFEGLKKAIDIEEGGYTLGYYVDSYRTREQLAKVKVNSSRGGVKISHRRGYFEQPSIGAIGGRIALGTRRPLRSGEPGQYVPFTVEANPYLLGYEVARGVAQAHFTLHVLVRGANGRLLADSFHFINHAYPREIWDAEQAEPITIEGWVQLPDGHYTLVAYFQNSRSGREGELTQDLVVSSTGPPVAADPVGGAR